MLAAPCHLQGVSFELDCLRRHNRNVIALGIHDLSSFEVGKNFENIQVRMGWLCHESLQSLAVLG